MTSPPTLDGEALAARLRQRADELGLSHRALARGVGTHHNVIARWLAGERTPHARHLPALADALATSLDWLLLGRRSDDALAQRLAALSPAVSELAQLAEGAARHGATGGRTEDSA